MQGSFFFQNAAMWARRGGAPLAAAASLAFGASSFGSWTTPSTVFAEQQNGANAGNEDDDKFIVKQALDPNNFKKFKVRDVKPLTHDTKRLRIDLPSEHHVTGLETASCLVAKAEIDGKNVIRPYTPTTKDNQKGYFDLVVKGYPQGKVSKHLVNKQPGDEVEVKGPFQKMKIERNMKNAIGLVAGGSGITPMLQVIQHLLDDPRDNTEIRLLYCNVSEDDIILKNRLDALAMLHPRFKVYYAADSPKSQEWDGYKGRPNKQMLAETMPPPDEKHLIMVCGPPGMMKAISGDKKSKSDQGEVEGMLKDMNYSKDMVFKF
eukprot:gb/GECG01013651.1/.p1 GENE.gb/GECG01013651.1/~~gb/GECG01013651.1/.p1  ORF type:complete len:319 (+),score=51.62 gb/GECG01013651.1/:1-957(+)